ncbi:MAG: hypothetical protein WBK65_07225, partial [Thermotogota bacterium]
RGNQRADFGSPRSLAILMKSSNPLEKKRIAPSRKEGALTPRCCSREDPGNAKRRWVIAG